MAAAETPLSPPRPDKSAFKLPIPPPLLHTRSGPEILDAPHTPRSLGFTSPFSTPQGSPSKNKLPPGANELPNVFENALKLTQDSSNKSNGRQQLGAYSLTKDLRSELAGAYDNRTSYQESKASSATSSKRPETENTPPSIWQAKEAAYNPTQAAISRQEQYQSRENSDAAVRSRHNTHRGLTQEEIEKLQLPKVKRLANVTQLCKKFLEYSSTLILTGG